MNKVQFLTFIFFMIFMQACVNSFEKDIIKNTNKNLSKMNSPYEFVLETQTTKAYYYSNTKLRGKPSKTSILKSKEVQNDILEMIFKKCGYKSLDLRQTRLVSNNLPTIKEIWVFKDEKSAMKDKTTALLITMTQNQDNNRTYLNILGACPAKIDKLTFLK